MLIFPFHLPLRLGFLFWGGRRFFFLFLLLPILFAGCEEEESGGEPEKHSRVFEFNEKYIIRGIANLLKEKGYADPKVDFEKGKVETDYILQGNLRFKVETTVKKLDRREREVVLLITTEKKTKGGWKATKMLDKSHYDRFFDELEMQIYREMAKGD